jgi:hypothetical protein
MFCTFTSALAVLYVQCPMGCDYGFATVVKKWGNKPGNIPNLPNSVIQKSKPTIVGINNSTSTL